MEILGERAVQKITSPLAKYEKFAALTLIYLIQQGIGADAFLWPRMFFKATLSVRYLAFHIDQREGIDLIAIRTKDKLGLPIQIKVAERGYGVTKFRKAHPEIPIIFTGKWDKNPPQYIQEHVLMQTAHTVNDSSKRLWKPIHCMRYTQMKNHLPRHLRE